MPQFSYNFHVSGFKAIRDASLSISGLTVVVGANSTGKSSLAQSLLLLSRALSSRRGRVRINDQVLSLAKFNDAVNRGSKNVQIEMEKSVTFYESKEKTGGTPSGDTDDKRAPLQFSEKVSVVLTEAKNSKTEGFLSVKTQSSSKKSKQVELAGQEVILGNLGQLERMVISEYMPPNIPNPMKVILLQTTAEGPDSKPQRFTMISKRLLLTNLSEMYGRRSRPRSDDTESTSISSKEIQKEFNVWLNENNEELRSSEREKLVALLQNTYDGLLDSLSGTQEAILKTGPLVRGTAPRELTLLLENLWNQNPGYADVFKSLEGIFKDDEYVWVDLYFTRLSIIFSRDLSLPVNFLGPLRKRSLSSSFPETYEVDNAPVGTDGSQLAAVLDQRFKTGNGRNYPTPYGLEADLKRSISEWLEYFDMPSIIDTDDNQLGYFITLAHKDETQQISRRLDEYGTGVSQLLPVIALILMAEEEDVTVIEQPELHLHPLAQLKLADFLMKYSKVRNILVETHSEYLVTRLRRNVALGVVANGVPRPRLYFTRANEGYSEVIEAPISDDGRNDTWPASFNSFTKSDELDIFEARILSEQSGENGD